MVSPIELDFGDCTTALMVSVDWDWSFPAQGLSCCNSVGRFRIPVLLECGLLEIER